MEKIRRILFEISLILVVSLLLSIIYSIVSPAGMIIMKRMFKKNASVERAVHTSEVDAPVVRMQGYL
ncbi:MAG: hypothetical protein Q8K51_00610 [Nitrospirota bacterium]|nr:hypothetical protein [Nitrospirota bacterium]